MKRFLLLIISAALFLTPQSLYGKRIIYAEQYYELYHLHMYQSPDDTMEQIYYLERALAADFCNPLYALAKVKDRNEWEQYRYLFKMHLNLKIVQLYLTLASKWDKRVAFFYNAPWKEQNLESLAQAEELYKLSYYYWDEALSWAKKLSRLRYNLEGIQNWEDEYWRIRQGELDYKEIIDEQMARLNRVRKDFEAMDQRTY